MFLRFKTLRARHFRRRNWDIVQSRRQAATELVGPPFWDLEPEDDPSTTGVTEIIAQVYAQAPDRFRIEHPTVTWLGIGNQWWEWGRDRPPLHDEDANVVGHLELQRLAWLFDPDHEAIGYGARPDGIEEISEFLDATYDQPLGRPRPPGRTSLREVPAGLSEIRRSAGLSAMARLGPRDDASRRRG